MTDHTQVAVDDSSSDAMPWLPIVLAIVLGSTLATEYDLWRDHGWEGVAACAPLAAGLIAGQIAVVGAIVGGRALCRRRRRKAPETPTELVHASHRDTPAARPSMKTWQWLAIVLGGAVYVLVLKIVASVVLQRINPVTPVVAVVGFAAMFFAVGAPILGYLEVRARARRKHDQGSEGRGLQQHL